jgi:hypothetical protein
LIHFDNAPVQNSRLSNEWLGQQMPMESRIRHRVLIWHRVTYFSLDGFLKEKLRGIALSDEENFISRILVIFEEIFESILVSVYMTQFFERGHIWDMQLRSISDDISRMILFIIINEK